MSMHERRSEMRTCRTQRSMLERAVFGWPMPVPVWRPSDLFRIAVPGGVACWPVHPWRG